MLRKYHFSHTRSVKGGLDYIWRGQKQGEYLGDAYLRMHFEQHLHEFLKVEPELRISLTPHEEILIKTTDQTTSRISHLETELDHSKKEIERLRKEREINGRKKAIEIEELKEKIRGREKEKADLEQRIHRTEEKLVDLTKLVEKLIENSS